MAGIKESGGACEYPPAPLCEYLLGYLYEVGPVLSGGMGNTPLTHSEIRAWQDNTGVELSAWESQTLRRLSAEYLGESQSAESPDAPAPWQREQSHEEKQSVSSKVQNAFRLLLSTRPKK